MYKNSKQFISFIALSVFVLTTLFAGVFAPVHTANAQGIVPVGDAQNLVVNTTTAKSTVSLEVKEQVLDGIMVGVGKQIISHITQSIVNWINSGFEGGPAFVADPGAFFTDVADQVTGQFIDRLGLDFLCGSFTIPIQAALRLNFDYGGAQGQSAIKRYRCTASAVVDNVSSGNIVNLDSFFDVAVSTNNNPYGAYLAAQQDLELQILNQRVNLGTELNWGNGFLSQKKDCDENGQNCRSVTPGSLVEDQLVNVFGSGLRQLELADEINEIVNALANQLINTMIDKGLSGLSQATEGAESFINKLPVNASADLEVVMNKNLQTQAICYQYGPNPENPNELICLDEQIISTDTDFENALDGAGDFVPNVPQFGSILNRATAWFISSDGSVEPATIDGVAQEARYALDGRTDGAISASREGAFIRGERGGGIKIELDDTMVIDEISVYRATNEMGDDYEPDGRTITLNEALGAELEIILFDASGNEVASFTEGTRAEIPVKIPIDGELAQFVEIRRTGNETGNFAVAEIEMDGTNIYSVQRSNVALGSYGGIARSSSRRRSSLSAPNAINGQNAGGGQAYWRFISGEETGPWWEVDLVGKEALIEKVVIYHGNNGLLWFKGTRVSAYLNGRVVYSVDILPQTVSPAEINLTSSGEAYTVVLNQTGERTPSGIRADTVRIERIAVEYEGTSYGAHGTLELGEVEVLGRVLKQD